MTTEVNAKLIRKIEKLTQQLAASREKVHKEKKKLNKQLLKLQLSVSSS